MPRLRSSARKFGLKGTDCARIYIRCPLPPFSYYKPFTERERGKVVLRLTATDVCSAPFQIEYGGSLCILIAIEGLGRRYALSRSTNRDICVFRLSAAACRLADRTPMPCRRGGVARSNNHLPLYSRVFSLPVSRMCSSIVDLPTPRAPRIAMSRPSQLIWLYK